MINFFKKTKESLKGVLKAMKEAIIKKEPTPSVLSMRKYPKFFSVQLQNCGKSLMSLTKYNLDEKDIYDGEKSSDKKE